MTVAVLGMHRSGTSLLAKILVELGLYLGPDTDIIQPHSIDNPEGYWENERVIAINDKLLEYLGGSDQRVPQILKGWTTNPQVQPYKEDGRSWIREFEAQTLWGWKDPRTMLTLEYWRELIPDLKLVLIYRNPFEVALSLARRTDYLEAFYVPTLQRALYLWQRYHEVMLENLDPKEVYACSYDSFFDEPEEKVREIVAHLGVEVDESRMRAALGAINPQLRRNRMSWTLLEGDFVPEAARQVYANLLKLSGEERDTSQAADKDIRRLLGISFKQLQEGTHQVEGWRAKMIDADQGKSDAEHSLKNLRAELERLMARQKEDKEVLLKDREDLIAKIQNLDEQLRIERERSGQLQAEVTGLRLSNEALKATVGMFPEIANSFRPRTFYDTVRAVYRKIRRR